MGGFCVYFIFFILVMLLEGFSVLMLIREFEFFFSSLDLNEFCL